MLKSKQLYTKLLVFFKSTDFAKALLVTLGLLLPLLIGFYANALNIGIALGTGVIFSSPSSITGSVKNKRIGILLSTCIAALVSFLGAYIPQILWVQLVYLGAFAFLLSYLAVYGFRASLVGFSGLFALVLSFANLSASGLESYERALLIACGGIWYLALTVIYDLIAPKKQIEEHLETAIMLSASYIEARGKFLNQSTERNEGLKTLFAVQSNFTEHLEKLREILLNNRYASGTSSYYRQRFLVLSELVDLSELSLTSPIPPKKMHDVLGQHPEQLHAFIDLNKAQSESLKCIVKNDSTKRNPNLKPLKEALTEAKNQLQIYTERHEFNEDYIILNNLYELQERQSQHILNIAQILNRSKNLAPANTPSPREFEDFVTKQDYSFQIIIDNLNLNSPIFRHALRLAVTAIVGFSLGHFFEVQNPYWILLTIIVIMRPGYGLTKQRSKHRITGTLIGAALAAGIIYFFPDKMLYRVLAILSYMLALASLQKNYRTAALFITLGIIFAYALLRPDILDVIKFRVLDTALGALLAGLANSFLWPTREALSLQHNLAESLQANRDYLQQIRDQYLNKNEISVSYKLARKKAFLATATVNATIQRMLQEPASKRKYNSKFYDLVVLNHAFLGALASIGSYLRNHKITQMDAAFTTFTDTILENIHTAVALLEHTPQTPAQNAAQKLPEIPISEKNEEVYEMHIVTEQLKWLQSLSEQFMKQLRALEV